MHARTPHLAPQIAVPIALNVRSNVHGLLTMSAPHQRAGEKKSAKVFVGRSTLLNVELLRGIVLRMTLHNEQDSPRG